MKIANVTIALALACTATLRAQSFFTTPTARYLTPSWRGTGGTEFSRWDVFYSPYQYANLPDIEAPSGIGQLASEALVAPPPNSDPGDPYAFWNAANPTLTQLNDVGAFIIGAGTAGNIYSFGGATAYHLADTTPFVAGSVMMQWQTDGSLIDYSTLKLISNGVEYLPTNFITEYKTSGSPRGGLTNRTAAQWDLTGLGITDYVISFSSAGSSNSFQELLLDTTPTYVEAVPSARTRTAATGLWSAAASWTPGTLPPTGGNVGIASGTSLTVDGGTREIGELKLSVPGSYSILPGGGVLKLNTGITATPASATSYTISAPVQLGSFSLFDLNANTELTVSSVISGSTGIDIFGGGKLKLTGNNTFAGSFTVEGGIVEVSGANTYNGVTTVASGELTVKANAPASAAGALGNAASAVAVGSGGSEGEPEASLIVDGAFAVGRKLSLTIGDDGKRVGGRNTGTGATFSGDISLGSTANNVRLTAEGAADKVTFSGGITGGGAGKTLTKTGDGLVVFSGAAKTYTNDTTVEAGALELATGSGYSGNGGVTVASGARLIVNGSLGGTGTLNLAGGTLGGNGTVNRTFSVDAGDLLAPGTSVGALSTFGETWAGGGRFALEFQDATGSAGSGWDLVNITGTLSISANSGAPFTLTLATLAPGGGGVGLLEHFDSSTNFSWKFASATTIAGFDATDFLVDTNGFVNSLNGGIFTVSQVGNDLNLNFLAAPEPSSALLLAFGGALIVRRRRVGR